MNRCHQCGDAKGCAHGFIRRSFVFNTIRWFFRVTLPDAMERAWWRWRNVRGKIVMWCEICGSQYQARLITNAQNDVPAGVTINVRLPRCPVCVGTIDAIRERL